MLKSKLSAFFSLLVVFLSGGVAGVFVYRAYNPPPHIQPPPKPEDIRKRIVNDMKRDIHLDDQQVVQLEKIMDDIRAQGEEMRKQMNEHGRTIRDHQQEEIRKMLRPEQQPLYDKWLQERQLERQRRQQEKGKEGGGGFRQDKDK